MDGETPTGIPEPPHLINLQSLKDAKQIQSVPQAEFYQVRLSRPDMLYLNPGHLAELAKSPLASALIDPSQELFIQKEATSEFAIEALIPAETLVERVLALNELQRADALKIILDVVRREISQDHFNGMQESVMETRLVVQKFQAIAILDELLKTGPTAELYETVSRGHLATIRHRLKENNWEKVRNELNSEFPETSA